MELIQDLNANYTHIFAMQIAEKNEKTRSQYNMGELLKSFTESLNKCSDFAAAASKSVSETQLVRIAYGLVAET